ncbi:DUF4062 domain-containing protein [Tenacibaculum ovolyticum]|uniref:DUF4062 domain-containing protein n=1 Tax=Tenacibaculum ovolyticum TaxID=104270 RepID=UPI0007ED1094|nr:DUF4062 domain-containing protein [Tenacibaculum ovolyticum]
MAIPRIFVSSTCYDLSEIRDNLYSFIENLGYTPVFSDKNDVFYHPDLHSHESCIKEIETCQIFILIIGGRFGGKYVYNTDKSIVNAEYDAAKKLNIPIFTFIKRETHEDHRFFISNRSKKPELYRELNYPAIDKQETAIKIFEFIDEVRKSDINNAYFTFEFAKDIRETLKKQFAGLFYDFLWSRTKEKEFEKTNKLLSNLTALGKKTEDIIENIYKTVDEKDAQKNINKFETELKARKFYYKILSRFSVNVPKGEDIDILKKINKKDKWYDYLAKGKKFEIQKNLEYDGYTGTLLVHVSTNRGIVIEVTEGEIRPEDIEINGLLSNYFESVKSLSPENLSKVLNDLE